MNYLKHLKIKCLQIKFKIITNNHQGLLILYYLTLDYVQMLPSLASFFVYFSMAV